MEKRKRIVRIRRRRSKLICTLNLKSVWEVSKKDLLVPFICLCCGITIKRGQIKRFELWTSGLDAFKGFF